MWNDFCNYARTLSIWKSDDLEGTAEVYTIMNVSKKEVRNRLFIVFQDKNKLVQVKLGGIKCKTNKKKEGETLHNG